MMSPLTRLAVWLTQKVGTMSFFFSVTGGMLLWIAWNSLASPGLQFDPPLGFVFLLLISNVLQMGLMPLIMVGQNVMGIKADERAQRDFEVDTKAEQEIREVITMLKQMAKQGPPS